MPAVDRKHATQAPTHQADLAAAGVVQVANFLLHALCVAGLETHVAAKSPGVDVVTSVGQKRLQSDERAFVAHEPGDEQHAVAITARRVQQHRQGPGQQGHLDQRAPLHQRIHQRGRALVGVALGHRHGALHVSELRHFKG